MKKNILLVDDDVDEVELLTEVFSEIDANIKCRHAENGQVALDLLEKNSFVYPDIILLDINMPVMNGWDFLKKVKTLPDLKDIPIVMYSTSNRERDLELANALGVRHFIKKPDNYQTLKREIEALLLKVEAVITYLKMKFDLLRIQASGQMQDPGLQLLFNRYSAGL